ncbi:hypothetical protein ACH5RR_029102 [Cinchona calisaya]|uniref:Uncharacterized protein n=1 Tax=Cinchona calisaya TaxID=153742 RepID=A0ABD2YS47_9GENT
MVDVYKVEKMTYLLKGGDGESSTNRDIKQQLELDEVEMMANKAVDEIGTPQKADPREKFIAKKKTPKKMRKLVAAMAAAANSEAEVLENAGNENMEAVNGGENMQGGFDAEISPANGGENMQKGDGINTEDHGLNGGTNDEACSSRAKGDTNKKIEAKKFKKEKVQNVDEGLENEDSSSTEVFHESDYDFDDEDFEELNSNASDGKGDEINESMRKYPRFKTVVDMDDSKSNPGSTMLLASKTNDDGDEDGEEKRMDDKIQHVCPKIQKLLEQIKEDSKACIPARAGEWKYEIRCTYGDQYVVDLDQQDEQSIVDGATTQDDACAGGNTENNESASVEPTATTKHGTCVSGAEKIAEFEQSKDETWLDELISSTIINIASQQPIPSFDNGGFKPSKYSCDCVMQMVIIGTAAQNLLLNFTNVTNQLQQQINVPMLQKDQKKLLGLGLQEKLQPEILLPYVPNLLSNILMLKIYCYAIQKEQV